MSKRTSMWLVGLIALALGLVIGSQLNGFLSGGSDDAQMASSQGMSNVPVYQSGPFKVSVAVNPEAPKVGENKLMVKVMDAHGNPVEDANIQAFGEMSAMGVMQAMRAPANVEQVAPGEYAGPMNIEMSGEWPLSVKIEKPGAGETALSFDMATGRAGLSIISGGTMVKSAAEGMASQGSEPTYRAGPFKFDVAVEPETPKIGKNRLIIDLHDSQGNPIPGAQIKAIAEMPAMGAMQAMQASAVFEETAPGRYLGAFELPTSGEWPLSVQIEKAGIGSQRITFDMATGRSGLQVVSGAMAEGQSGMQAEEAPANAILVDSRSRQLIGLETGAATYRHLTRDIRAVGQVVYDERKLSDVTLRFNAWIGELYADYVGKYVNKGEVLFTVYGPELLAAQQQYLEVLKGRFGQSSGLIEAARKRLLLWDMAPSQIEELEQRGEPLDYVPIMAPRSGTVVEKNVVIGSAMMAGTRLMRIADLSKVWVEAEVYEAELPLVKVGMAAVVTLPYVPGKIYQAKVDYVYPYLQGMTRTGRIRLTLNNQDGVLKPDMYAQVNLKVYLGQRLVVPEEAVLFAGESRIVFEDFGGGRLAPRKVRTGVRNEGYIEIVEGLEPGDKIVTSGNFLIASEARLKTGIEQW
ncbi:MAG: efflux RND transporter periplasmic adaptor subunit [Gammaproteobacteria bacterium]